MDIENVTFVQNGVRFNYRVAAFITCGNKVLLQKSPKFYNMPGGRVQFGESTEDAVIRELKEEMGVEIKNFTLIQICENFFDWMGYRQQELLFVYKVQVDGNDELASRDNFKCADSENEIFSWHELKEVEKLNCLPEIIYDLAKRDDFTNVKHMVFKK